MSIIAGILVLGFIVFFHELGHFLAAKKNGFTVLEFSLGMGPRLVSFTRGSTRYSLKLLPFGGSCMMLGEDGDEEDAAAFNNRPVFARILVVAAGPFFNFLLAFLLSMVLIAFTGYGKPPLIKEVVSGSGAEAAGLRAGDLVTRMDGRSVHSYEDIIFYIYTHPSDSVELIFKRADENGRLKAYKADFERTYQPESGNYTMGIIFEGGSLKADNPLILAREALYSLRFWIRYCLDSLHLLISGRVSADEIGGPVAIVSAIDTTVTEAKSYGFSVVLLSLANFSVLLSANLGVMNLLPVPALDGGRLLFLFIEAIRGKPIDREKEGMVHAAGMLFLLMLMALVLFNDIRRLF